MSYRLRSCDMELIMIRERDNSSSITYCANVQKGSHSEHTRKPSFLWKVPLPRNIQWDSQSSCGLLSIMFQSETTTRQKSKELIDGKEMGSTDTWKRKNKRYTLCLNCASWSLDQSLADAMASDTTAISTPLDNVPLYNV